MQRVEVELTPATAEALSRNATHEARLDEFGGNAKPPPQPRPSKSPARTASAGRVPASQLQLPGSMIDAPVEGPLDRARMATQAVSFVLVVSLSVLFGYGGWLALVSALLATGVLLLGVANVEQLVVGWLTRPSSGASWLHVPLTDTTLNMDALNRLANSCQRGRS
jgi:hypothetical protein